MNTPEAIADQFYSTLMAWMKMNTGSVRPPEKVQGREAWHLPRATWAGYKQRHQLLPWDKVKLLVADCCWRAHKSEAETRRDAEMWRRHWLDAERRILEASSAHAAGTGERSIGEGETKPAWANEAPTALPSEDTTVEDQFPEFSESTFVRRREVEGHWARFLDASRLTFALVGESGHGKSSIICDQYKRLAPRPRLLVRASTVGSSLMTRILCAARPGGAANLPDPRDRDALWRLIADELHGANGPLLVFVDALDVPGNDVKAAANLTSDLDHIASQDPRGELLRLILTCTPSAWADISYQKGKPTALGRSVYADQDDHFLRARGLEVPEFKDEWEGDELDQALAKHGLDDLPGHWRVLCRNPQILRMAALLSPVKRDGLPQMASLTMLIDNILAERFPNAGDRREALNALKFIGRYMLDKQITAVDDSDRHRAPWTPERREIEERAAEAGLLQINDYELKFQHTGVIGEHILGRNVHDALFAKATPQEAVAYLRTLCEKRLDMPGIVAAALTYRFDVPIEHVDGQDILYECVREMARMNDSWAAVALMVIKRAGDLEPRFEGVLADLSCSESFPIREYAADVLWRNRKWEDAIDKTWQGQETIALSYAKAPRCTGKSCHRVWELADHYHWRVRRAAGYALHEHWPVCRDHHQWLQEIAEGDPAHTWRKGHALLIALTGGPNRAPAGHTPGDDDYIRRCAESSSSQLRWLAAYYMGQYPPSTMKGLSSIFNDRESNPWVLATFGQSLVKAIHEASEPSAIDHLARHLQRLLDRHADAVGVRVARTAGRLRSARLDEILTDLSAYSNRPDIVRAATYEIGGEFVAADPNVWVEKVAHQDFSHLPLARDNVHTFVARREKASLIDDPYVRSFELMRHLLIEAIAQLKHGDDTSVADQFLEAVCNDADEGLRWALVLCLAEEPPLTNETIATQVARLSNDPHMWVRREVASHLMVWVRRGILEARHARHLLAHMSWTLGSEDLDIRQEVMPRVEEARKALADWELAQRTRGTLASANTALQSLPRIDLIWSLTLICPWDCGMCCVDAVHVKKRGGAVEIRSQGLEKLESYALDINYLPDPFEAAARRRQEEGLELKLYEKLGVIDNIAGYNAKIDISGGDPMVLPENLEVIRAASAAFGRHNVTMTATGRGLVNWDANDLAPLIGELNFTYDSPSRGTEGLRPKSYARSNLNQARKFSDAGVLVRAECPLTTSNCDDNSLDEMYLALTEAGIPRLLLMRLFPSGRGTDVSLYTPTSAQYQAAIARLRWLEETVEGGPTVRLQCALRHLEGSADGAANPCDLMRESFGLLTDGTLLASPWATNRQGSPMADEWVLGNLAIDPLGQILEQTPARGYRDRLDENFGHCKIFAFLNSNRASVEDKIFDTADPLYAERPVAEAN